MTSSSSPKSSSPLKGKNANTNTSPLRPSSPTTAKSSPSKTPTKSSPTKSPSKATATATSTSTTSRPSAEDLIDLERELHRLIARKTGAEANLATLEGRLYDLETEYLTETGPFGNLIVGLEGYLGLPSAAIASNNNNSITSNSSAAANARRSAFASGAASIAALSAGGIAPAQRLFSATSTTFPESLAVLGRMDEAVGCGFDPSAGVKDSSNGLKKIPGLPAKSVSTHSSHQKSPTKSNNSNKKQVKKSSLSSQKATETWTPPPMKRKK